MGYRQVEGVVLRRQDRFETDQFIQFLTKNHGVLSVRVPHGQKSQKTHCGRLEPPNLIDARLYQSREDGPWTLSESSIATVYAELMADEEVKKELWPLLSLFDDLFPEGQTPGQSYHRFKKALRMLKDGFRPAVLIASRLLVRTAREVGITVAPTRCRQCDAETSDQWVIDPERGLFCGECGDVSTEFRIDERARRTYEWLLMDEWEELAARELAVGALGEIESVLYRLFHYHFEISLDTLNVRQSL